MAKDFYFIVLILNKKEQREHAPYFLFLTDFYSITSLILYTLGRVCLNFHPLFLFVFFLKYISDKTSSYPR